MRGGPVAFTRLRDPGSGGVPLSACACTVSAWTTMPMSTAHSTRLPTHVLAPS